MPFDFVPVTISDIDDICDLIDEIWDEDSILITDNGFDPWKEQTRKFFQASIDDPRINALVLRNDSGKLIACGAAVICEHDPHHYFVKGDQFGYIRLMRVAKKERGNGIATAMLKAFMTWYKQNDIVEIHLHASDQARPLYERAGFRVSKTVDMWYHPELELADL
jgi:GNAT superfamily N-acetyltransferase